MPEEAAAVAEPLETGVPDAGVDLGESAAAEPDEAAQGAGEGQPEQPGAAAATPEPDGRMLSPDVRAHLAELKASNPTLAGKIRDAFGQAAAIRKEFPGGLQEARSIKQLAAEIGGAEGVRELQASVEEIAELDRLWEGKDPRAVDSMAEDYPEQFVELMPHAMETWQKRDPEGFNRNACAVVAATFQAANQEGYSALNLLWMADQSLALGNPEQAKAIIGQLQEWAKGFGRTAATPPKPRETAPNADKDRADKLQQQLQQQEQSSFDQSVGTAVEAFAESKMEAAIAPFIKGKSLTEGQRETLNAKVISNLMKRLTADKQFIEARERYTAAKDKNGLVQMSKAKIEALLPTEVKDAYRWLFGGSAPKQSTAPSKPSNGTAASPTAKPWIKVASVPNPHEVDPATPFEMKRWSSAILKDGRRVYWGQQPYQGK